MYFTLFPPISIEGSAQKTLDLPGLEALKSIHATSEKISVSIEIEENTKIFDVISFNKPSPDVNTRIEPHDDLPLELMPLVTIEFLEELAQLVNGYCLLTNESPKAGYLECFRGDIYPISVRGSSKELYAQTAELHPLRKDYFVALNSLLQIDFEEQLENSLATFVDNVLRPMSETLEEVVSLDETVDCDDNSIIKVIGSDFKKLVSRTEELISIVNYNMDQTAERNKAFLRLTLPLMLKQALLENFSDYISFETDLNTIQLKINKRKSISAEELAILVLKFLK
ncbi:MAG: hypothetical protein ACW964_10135 [Candidatus Hodarchaeales archaeon]|jgi:hypothetical protein